MTVLERPSIPPPDDLTLSCNDVHVWRAALDRSVTCVRQLVQTLSDDERMRAGRFRFERDRKRFVVARGVLRAILGRYLNVEPSRMRFCYGPQGKPGLMERFGGGALWFNLAHSHELALYAFVCVRKIGIDLERTRTDFPFEQLAERFFSPREKAVLCALPTKSAKQEAFFNCWTRKEAYIKARGDGLSFPLEQFDVTLAPGEPAALLNVRGDPLEASRWTLQELIPVPGYVAALAVEGRGWRLSFWEWRE